MEDNQILVVKKAEFFLSDGHVVMFLLNGSVTLSRSGCASRTIQTKRLPTIDNARWLVENYPTKPYPKTNDDKKK